MTRIGLISDTHSYLDNRILEHLHSVDEIWHAGDIGSLEVIDQLKSLGKTLRIVFGNIDDHLIRNETHEFLRFQAEKVDVLMTHIAGKPGKYAKPAYDSLMEKPPKLFICGHSHTLLVKTDPKFKMLWMNPGACGIKGFHSVRTMLRFSITDDRIHDLEVIELGKRA